MNIEKLNLVELNVLEIQETEGGLFVEVLAAGAALLYAYEWGYNYAHQRTH